MKQHTRKLITSKTLADATQKDEEAAVVMIQRYVKSKWDSARNAHKAQLSLTRARYRIRGRRNAKEEFCEVVDGKYWEQGDLEMHDLKVWEQRMLLRKHPKVTAQLKRWCAIVPTPVCFDDYVQLMMRLYKVCLPEFCAEDAMFTAEEDWADDVKAAVLYHGVVDRGKKSRLPAPALMDSLFQLADLWTFSVSAVMYAEFLGRLFKAVASECNVNQQNGDGLGAYGIGPGGVLLDANGRPIIGKDGLPLMSGNGSLHPDGVVMDSNRNIVRGPDNRAIRVNANVAPGQVIYDTMGRPVLGPDGNPLRGDRHFTAGALMLTDPDDTPILSKQDGKPLVFPLTMAIPPGGSIGAGGVVLDAQGKPVLDADGQPVVIDARIPAGSSIGRDGVVVDAAGNRILGADGMSIAIGVTQGLKPLGDIEYVNFQAAMEMSAANELAKKKKLALEEREAKQRKAAPKIPVRALKGVPLQYSREHRNPSRAILWGAQTTQNAPALLPWRPQPGPAPGYSSAQSHAAWQQVFRRPATVEAVSPGRTPRLHCMPDLSSPARSPPSPSAFEHTSSSGFKLTPLKEVTEPLQKLRRGDVSSYGRVAHLHSPAPPDLSSPRGSSPPSPRSFNHTTNSLREDGSTLLGLVHPIMLHKAKFDVNIGEAKVVAELKRLTANAASEAAWRKASEVQELAHLADAAVKRGDNDEAAALRAREKLTRDLLGVANAQAEQLEKMAKAAESEAAHLSLTPRTTARAATASPAYSPGSMRNASTRTRAELSRTAPSGKSSPKLKNWLKYCSPSELLVERSSATSFADEFADGKALGSTW